ncbi:MAG: patatin-like phospholipase family protein [Anaerolineae bacterium]|nr:patatin-like phospholipase family protein [Anaerolineae bacterium]
MKRSLWSRLLRRKPPTVGFALSGGGVRGLAHIGVLKVLTEAGIPIHALAGTSAGGFVGAFYAAGFSPQAMKEEALRVTATSSRFSFLQRTLPFRGILSTQKVIEYLQKFLGDLTFDQLRVPLAVVAVDLRSGEKVVLNQGRVLDAVRATIALPGLFTPVELNNWLLVDGGLLDHLPVGVLRQMGVDLAIAVDVASDESTLDTLTEELRRRPFVPDGLVELADVLVRSLSVMMREITRRNIEEAHPDLFIRPAIPPYVTALTGLNRAAEVIAAGEEAARAALPELQALLAGRHRSG